MQILDCENETIKFHYIHEKLMLNKLCEGIENIYEYHITELENVN